MKKNITKAALASFLTITSAPLFAIPINDNLSLHGAIRARFDYDPDRDIDKLGIDTVRLALQYNSSSWIGGVRWRYYGKAYPYNYTKKFGDISFPEYAWVGYKFDDNRQLQAGLNQVPFGLQPLFGNTFTETLGYPLGFEDLYEVGVKYAEQRGDWNFQGGYYARPAWQGKGTSKGGVTYSNVPSNADSYVTDGSNNQERNTFALRVSKGMDIDGWASEVGVSGLTSTLENADTNANGRRYIAAGHIYSKKGPWTVQVLAARQVMSPRNPGNDDVVTFGGYDSTYNIAARGTLYTGDLSYDISGTYLKYINNLKLYGSYGEFQKSGREYKDTQRFITGISFYVGSSVWIATEWLFGKNDPYVGGSSYTQSLAVGGTNHWENQLYMNIGYYF